jgi:hypothetical protein
MYSLQILKHLQGETRAEETSGVFKITTADGSYTSSMESGESVGPRPRRTKWGQGNTSNDCNREQTELQQRTKFETRGGEVKIFS